MLSGGVDIGGTKLAAGLLDENGSLVATRKTDSHIGLDESDLMDFVANTIRALCMDVGADAAALAGVGVGMAGHMRGKDGVVITTSNLPGFKNYPLARELSARLGTRVVLDNDANCQAWAEYRFGAGRGYDDMVFITVSTGIGAGLIINGRLHRGQTGTAGEIGHTIIQPDSAVECTCGNRGCFMSHACTLNLDALAREKSTRMKTRLLGDPASGGASSRRIDGKRIYAHAAAGDAAALEIINEYADYLGIMLYNVFQFLNPQAIVMGGGLMNWELGFFERIKAKFRTLAGDMLYDPLAIVKAGIGEDAGVIGAAALVREDFGE